MAASELLAIQTDPSKIWHAIWTFQLRFIFLACNSDAPEKNICKKCIIIINCICIYMICILYMLFNPLHDFKFVSDSFKIFC